MKLRVISLWVKVNVNLNVYTQTSLESRLQALETLESAFVN